LKALEWLQAGGISTARDSLETDSNYQVLRTLAEGTSVIWGEWEEIRSGQATEDQSWRILQLTDSPLLTIMKTSTNQAVGLLAGPGTIEQLWITGLQPLFDQQGVCIRLTDNTGKEILSHFSGNIELRAVRTSSETRLPWTLHLASTDPGTALAEFKTRNRLLLTGLILIAALVLFGSFLITRAVMHELRVARLQSDFVAAVSHEFRSPLTTMRQLSEMLARGRVENDERRNKYYSVLVREGERLHRLVEDLLDFGRMESRTMGYEMKSLDVVALTDTVVREFSMEVSDLGYQVDLSNATFPIMIQADPEALGRALWNLMDNAVKYSPDSKTIWVGLEMKDNRLELSVRDKGLGISSDEKEAIFDKFVRGDTSRQTHKGGTGIGLSMVKQIIEAHSGEIQLQSEPGVGSTFTILLPMED